MFKLEANIPLFQYPSLSPWQKTNKSNLSYQLKDIDLSLISDDRLGLIGLNGAGKTTLLKILAGVYPVTKGFVNSIGNIQPMLDNGIGFEAEASGFDNIFYRGYLLGKTKEQIKSKIDEIVEFTELKDHIHRPLKFYSTGMSMKLHFAISTAWESDILIMDEVMGVGDALFHSKAMNRINNHLLNAHIIVLASHNFELLKTYCNKILILTSGRPLFFGGINEGELIYKKYIDDLKDKMNAV
jgi:ABC-type polysaccharide/polyol phosphate transport system ATPase subunit